MRSYCIAACLFLSVCMTAAGQGIEFFHGSWEEALLKARHEDKIIFVDAFTTWCGPCKSMAANVFPDAAVGDFFNRHFISMKIDMEKEMGLDFKKSYPVSAYPTLFFIDYDKEVVLKSVGAKNATDLINMGESVIAKYDKSSKYEADYNAGDRSFQLVYNYVAALNKAGKPSVRIANEYLAAQTDLTTTDNLRFILEAASVVDCKAFELLEQYKPQIKKAFPDHAFEGRIRSAADNTLKRAIEFESPDLIITAADAMKRHLPAEADFFRSKANLQYALALNDLSQINELVNSHVKKFIRDDAAGLHQLALDLTKYAADHTACRALAIELAAKAARDKDPKFISTHAQLVYKSGNKQEALLILEDAIRRFKAGDETNKDLQQLKALKNKIENS